MSTTSKFGGKYTLTVELIDLAKEATIRGAKADFDGTEEGLRNAVDDVVSQVFGMRKEAMTKRVSTCDVYGDDNLVKLRLKELSDEWDKEDMRLDMLIVEAKSDAYIKQIKLIKMDNRIKRQRMLEEIRRRYLDCKENSDGGGSQ